MRAWVSAIALIAAAPLALPPTGAAATLPLRADRAAPTDLEVRGLLKGVPGGVRYLRWADLRALAVSTLKVTGEFGPGTQDLTVLFLSDLVEDLPLEKGADVVLAACKDQYASVYRRDFIAHYRPFLVLEINGVGPDRWPATGMAYNPGPYAILVSPMVAPDAAHFLDLPHKKPWGVVAIDLESFADVFHDAYAGRWASLSSRAVAGRDIWINSCASCHPGPGSTFGGSKSGMPFAVLEALASGNVPMFMSYVRNPKSINPNAKMEPHPHYSDDQLSEIAAFILAEPPSPGAGN